MIGLVVVAIGMSFGGMHGYANQSGARLRPPRCSRCLRDFEQWHHDGTRVWWIPVLAPLFGGLAGAALYDFGIRRYLKS